MSDIDTVVVDSLKALDPEWPIREADMGAWFGLPNERLWNLRRDVVTCGISCASNSSAMCSPRVFPLKPK